MNLNILPLIWHDPASPRRPTGWPNGPDHPTGTIFRANLSVEDVVASARLLLEFGAVAGEPFGRQAGL